MRKKISVILITSIIFTLLSTNIAFSETGGIAIETVDSNGNVGRFTSLAIDSNGNPHISYFDSSNSDLKFAYKDNTGWHISTVDSTKDVGQYTSLAIDNNNNPHISYLDYTNYDLKYAYKDNNAWYVSIIDNNGHGIASYTSLAIDNNENPHISYFDYTSDDLRYAYKDNTGWHVSGLDIYGYLGEYKSLAIDSNGNPHISYLYGQNLKYAYKDNTGWHVSTADSNGNIGYYTSLAIDNNDNPHISYLDYTNRDLKYAYKDNTGWHVSTVDSNENVGKYTSIAIDSSNNPHISYYDYTSNNLKYAYKDNTGWHALTLDSNGEVGQYTSLAIDNNDNPHISYYDYTNDDLKYATLYPKININANINIGLIEENEIHGEILELTNDGAIGLNITNIVSSSPSLVVEDIVGETIYPGETKEVQVFISASEVVTYYETLEIHSNDPDVVTVNISGQVTYSESNVDLKSLSITGETLDKEFDSDISVYEIISSDNLDSIEINTETVNPLSTININDEVSTGTTTKTISLNDGENLIPIVVTSEDGNTEKAYVISVNGTVSDEDLLDLEANGESVSGFNKDTESYTINVNNDVETIDISASPSDDKALMLIDNTIYQGGNRTIDLEVGENIIKVMVVAQDSTTKTYTLAVNRETANTDLNGIALDNGTLNEAFDPFTYSYTAVVNNTVDSITITPTTEDSNATVKVNNTDISTPVDLEVGENIATIEVTGVDGVSKKTYEIIITRREALEITNNSLPTGIAGGSYSAELSVEGGTAPYEWSATGLPDGLNISPTTGEITGTPTTEGEYTINIKVVVTSQDRFTEKAYILSVNGSVTDANLLDLSVNGESVSGFNKNTESYTINLNNDIKNIDISASPSNEEALILINNTIYQGGNKTIDLEVGENIIEIMVVAQDSTTKTYTLAVNRGTANANLSGIALSSGTLNETFDSFTYSYTAVVNNSVDSITVTPTTVDSNATVKVNGKDISTPVDLEVGENTVTIEVTGTDGVSKKTYEIIITRREALEIINTSLPIGIVGGSYNAELSAEGGKAPYTWSETGLPDGLDLDATTGEITGIPTTEGEYTANIKVVDATGIESTKALNIKINLGCGNGGYIITPKLDSAYTSDLTEDAIPIMTINEGVTGFKYLSIDIIPVTGHDGDEAALFTLFRNGKQISIIGFKTDLDNGKSIQACFNVQPGDVIKVFIVDELSNDINHSPSIL